MEREGETRETLIEGGRVEKKEVIVEELKKQLWLAGPLICVNLLQFCLRLILVSHLLELSLSGASIATSFASVTGFSLLGLWLGIICALVIQVLLLLTITLRNNLEEEAKKATERVYDCNPSGCSGLKLKCYKKCKREASYMQTIDGRKSWTS